MASRDSLEIRNLLAKGTVVQAAGQDTPVAFKLRYVGTGSVTSVTVTTATNIVMVTSDGGTDTYAFSSYATLGALVDAINKDGIFEAKMLGSLRTDATASRLLDGAISSTTDADYTTIWEVKLDTSTALQYAVCLSPKASFNAPSGHYVSLAEIKYVINMGTAAADSVQVYTRKGSSETKILSATSVDTTETTINFASGNGEITAGVDEDIVVLVKDAATLADAATNYLRIYGKVV